MDDVVPPPAAAPTPGAAPTPAAAPMLSQATKRQALAMYLNVFIVAICGLVYELLAGTLGSYLLGDSVTQFSLVIGLYLSAMGVGAWLSRSIERDLAARFLDIELAVALVGGLSAPVLFFAFAAVDHFQFLLLAVVFAVGTLVGLELPLLMRLLEGRLAFKDLVSRVLTFDYIGALAASLLFPLLLVPKLGLIRSSLVVGMANCAVALWGSHVLRTELGNRVRGLRVRGGLLLVGLAVLFLNADALTSRAEDEMYADSVIYSKTSSYQRIVVTRGKSGFQLFLNGNLQFASADEYRYHEALVHPVMLTATAPKRVLILGGGDGLALREVLTYDGVSEVTLVDLDPAMTELGRTLPLLTALNRHAFDDRRVRVINDDAMVWLTNAAATYDAIIIDFPDPNSFALGKLYTKLFYRRVLHHLTPGGAVAVQATSPLFARRSYWCIVETMRAAGFAVQPYHVTVPSFGQWGFALAKAAPFEPPQAAPQQPMRYLNPDALAAMFRFSADVSPVPVEVNHLDNQALVRYYEGEWRRWM